MFKKLFGSGSSGATSIDEKLRVLNDLLSCPPAAGSESLATQVKDLSRELATEFGTLERLLEEERKTTAAVRDQQARLEAELLEEQRSKADAQKECRALAEELQQEHAWLQDSCHRVSVLQVEASDLEAQVLTLNSTNLAQAQELEDARHEACCTKEALGGKEAALASALGQIQRLVVEGPHMSEFLEKMPFIPRLGALAATLDANYSRSRSLLSARPFTADPAAAVKAVEHETLEDRQPVVEPEAHAASVQTLDPELGCGLPSLQHLKGELGEQGKTAPDFFVAIGGAELHEELVLILKKYQGPHREEDEYLRGAVHTHIHKVIQNLYQNSQQAACDMQRRREREDCLVQEIRASSEELTKEFLEERNEQEGWRNERVGHLMAFFLEKLRAATSRELHEEVLERSQREFEALNGSALDRYEAKASQHDALTAAQRERVANLEAFQNRKESAFRQAHAMSGWARLACGMRITDEVANVKASLDVIQDAMEDAREMSVLEDRALQELKCGRALATEAVAVQERLVQEHEALAAHYRECKGLLTEFEAFVRRGYAGLRAKSRADTEAVLRDLPRDLAKMTALSEAFEEDLERQKRISLAVMAQTSADRQGYERQLRALEKKRRKGGDEFVRLKTQWDEANDELKGLSEDLESLEQQRAQGLKAFETYQEESVRAGVPGNCLDFRLQAGSWVSSFLFDERKCTSFRPPPRMLPYGGAASDAMPDAASVAQSFELVACSEDAGLWPAAAAGGGATEPRDPAAAAGAAQGRGTAVAGREWKEPTGPVGGTAADFAGGEGGAAGGPQAGAAGSAGSGAGRAGELPVAGEPGPRGELAIQYLK